jgi:protein TonB
MRRNESGESLKAMMRKVADFEQRQSDLLTRVNKSDFNIAPRTEKDKPDPVKTGSDAIDSTKNISRTAAEIFHRIEDENKRPQKTWITPSTRSVVYAEYLNAVSRKIEDLGTLHFPRKDGKQLYGTLVVQVPIFEDGTVYEREGGPKVVRSSGNRDLDRAALSIVRKSGPFAKFPEKMRPSKQGGDVFMTVYTFSFGRKNLDLTAIEAKQ